jgi:hypothetical protein
MWGKRRSFIRAAHFNKKSYLAYYSAKTRRKADFYIMAKRESASAWAGLHGKTVIESVNFNKTHHAKWCILKNVMFENFG